LKEEKKRLPQGRKEREEERWSMDERTVAAEGGVGSGGEKLTVGGGF